MAATTSDAKRLKTDAAPAPTKTDAPIEKEETAADGTAITGEAVRVAPEPDHPLLLEGRRRVPADEFALTHATEGRREMKAQSMEGQDAHLRHLGPRPPGGRHDALSGLAHRRRERRGRLV
eukprot:6045240-Prymnesium_polylepis.1